jgi:myo-inositol-1(or 4)-monophosphatase
VSIALQHRGQITQAVVYDPNRNDLFTASKGAGAYLNEKRIRVGRRDRLADGLIGTGFPFRKPEGLDEYMQMFRIMTERCAGLRRPGAAALDLAYVAAGRLDGFFEKGLQPWDMAAGSLLITEAGGIVGDFTGESDYLNKAQVLAGSPKIFAQMVPLLAPFGR